MRQLCRCLARLVPCTGIGAGFEQRRNRRSLAFPRSPVQRDLAIPGLCSGIGGDEVVHALLADIIYADAPYTVIQRAIHIHPTVSELIPTLLADLKPLV